MFQALKEGREPDLSDYKQFKITCENVGYQMLQKMGWKEGEGLGSEGQGIKNPVNKCVYLFIHCSSLQGIVAAAAVMGCVLWVTELPVQTYSSRPGGVIIRRLAGWARDFVGGSRDFTLGLGVIDA